MKIYLFSYHHQLIILFFLHYIVWLVKKFRYQNIQFFFINSHHFNYFTPFFSYSCFVLQIKRKSSHPNYAHFFICLRKHLNCKISPNKPEKLSTFILYSPYIYKIVCKSTIHWSFNEQKKYYSLFYVCKDLFIYIRLTFAIRLVLWLVIRSFLSF